MKTQDMDESPRVPPGSGGRVSLSQLRVGMDMEEGGENGRGTKPVFRVVEHGGRSSVGGRSRSRRSGGGGGSGGSGGGKASVDTLSSLLKEADAIQAKDVEGSSMGSSAGSSVGSLTGRESDREREREQERVFLLTAIAAGDKVKYMRAIQSLGGTTIASREYDTRCTHVLVGTPTRSEKYLGGCAGGKWLMKTEYVDACARAGVWLDERPYEWGAGSDDGPNSGIEYGDLAKASRAWRKYLSTRRRVAGAAAAGAFISWRVGLVVESGKAAGIARLIKAGGGSVAEDWLAAAERDDLTHVFFDVVKQGDAIYDSLLRVRGMGRREGGEDGEGEREGVKVLSMEYISDFLTAVPPGTRGADIDETYFELAPPANM